MNNTLHERCMVKRYKLRIRKSPIRDFFDEVKEWEIDPVYLPLVVNNEGGGLIWIPIAVCVVAMFKVIKMLQDHA